MSLGDDAPCHSLLRVQFTQSQKAACICDGGAAVRAQGRKKGPQSVCAELKPT